MQFSISVHTLSLVIKLIYLTLKLYRGNSVTINQIIKCSQHDVSQLSISVRTMPKQL